MFVKQSKIEETRATWGISDLDRINSQFNTGSSTEIVTFSVFTAIDTA